MKIPPRSRVPAQFRDLNPFDADTYRETVFAGLYEQFIPIEPPTDDDVPAVEEVVRYHPNFGFADRVLGVHVQRDWAVRIRNPKAVFLIFHFWNPDTRQEEFIAIPLADVPKFTRKVRYVLECRRAHHRGRTRTPSRGQ